ncbi:hypothetical protein SNEBB_004720 [Seison nebaliae]|nr:hypothetical protein SNEBB_004720 [Seison nebaliae]
MINNDRRCSNLVVIIYSYIKWIFECLWAKFKKIVKDENSSKILKKVILVQFFLLLWSSSISFLLCLMLQIGEIKQMEVNFNIQNNRLRAIESLFDEISSTYMMVPNHYHDIILHFQLPKHINNRKIGYFIVNSTINVRSNKEIIGVKSKDISVIIPFKSSLIELLDTLFYAFLYLFNWKTEDLFTENYLFHGKYFHKYNYPEEIIIDINSIDVVISRITLEVRPQMSFFRRIVNRFWRIFIIFFIFPLIYLMFSSFLLIFYCLFGSFVYLKENEEEVLINKIEKVE